MACKPLFTGRKQRTNTTTVKYLQNKKLFIEKWICVNNFWECAGTKDFSWFLFLLHLRWESSSSSDSPHVATRWPNDSLATRLIQRLVSDSSHVNHVAHEPGNKSAWKCLRKHVSFPWPPAGRGNWLDTFAFCQPTFLHVCQFPTISVLCEDLLFSCPCPAKFHGHMIIELEIVGEVHPFNMQRSEIPFACWMDAISCSTKNVVCDSLVELSSAMCT